MKQRGPKHTDIHFHSKYVTASREVGSAETCVSEASARFPLVYSCSFMYVCCFRCIRMQSTQHRSTWIMYIICLSSAALHHYYSRVLSHHIYYTFVFYRRNITDCESFMFRRSWSHRRLPSGSLAYSSLHPSPCLALPRHVFASLVIPVITPICVRTFALTSLKKQLVRKAWLGKDGWR